MKGLVLLTALLLSWQATAVGYREPLPLKNRDADVEAHTGPTANRTDRGTYVSRTEAQLSDWDKRLAELKSKRDAGTIDSVPYTRLQSRILAMESRVRDAREHLKQLEAASDESWPSYQA